MNRFCFHFDENNVAKKISDGLEYYFDGRLPVIICVGTDLTIGDSLGPIVGTMISDKFSQTYIYGKLGSPVTAKDIKPLKDFILKVHKNAKTLVIDAAIGNTGDVGYLKMSSAPIRPGLGANKLLPEIGNVNLIGIVAEKSAANYSFLNLTRLSPIYKMAQAISDGVVGYLEKTKLEQIKVELPTVRQASL